MDPFNEIIGEEARRAEYREALHAIVLSYIDHKDGGIFSEKLAWYMHHLEPYINGCDAPENGTTLRDYLSLAHHPSDVYKMLVIIIVSSLRDYIGRLPATETQKYYRNHQVPL